MRPLKLVIEGLRSFRAPVAIDFDDRDQLAIVGDTGAGKSSILDAITYALYRQTTFSKQPNQELMNASATQMRVVLTFRVSGETWAVTRALKRTKKGDVAAEQPELSRLGDSTKKLETLAGAASVDNRIRHLVGLDGDAFLRTVVLPQGNFARLLIADKPEERATVLRQVWRTDELERAGEVAGEKAAEAKTLLTKLDAEAAHYPEDPDAHLKTLRKDRDRMGNEAQRAERDLDAVDAAVAVLDAAEKEAKLCQGVLDDLEGADLSKLAARLDNIQNVDDEIARQDKELDDEAAEIEAKLKEIGQEDDGASLAKVTATVEQLNQVDGDVRKLTLIADDWHGLRERKADADERATKAKQDQNDAEQAAKGHSDKRRALDDALAIARVERADVETRYTACEQHRANLGEAQDMLRILQEKVEQQKARRAQLDDIVKAKQASKKQLDAELLDARRRDSAASAALGLHIGDSCPVCDRELPADWRAPTSAQISDAEQKAREAAAALQEAQQREADAAAMLDRLSAEHGGADKQREAASAKLQETLQALREIVPKVGSELPAKTAVLGPTERQQAEAQSAIERHEQEHVHLDDALHEAKERTDAAKENANDLALEEAKAHTRLLSNVGTLRDTLQALPRQFRPNITLPDDLSTDFDAIDAADLNEVREAAKNLQDELEETERNRKVLENQRRELHEHRDALSLRRKEQVDAPLDDMAARANNFLKTVNLAVGALGTSQKLPAALAKTDLPTIRSRLVEILEALEGTRQAAANGLRLAKERRQDANATLAKFAKRLDSAADDAETIAEAAKQANVAAQATKFLAEKAFEDFNAIVAAVQQLHAVRAKTEEKERALSTLSAALKPGAFLKWLTLRRSRSLLSHASVMLKQMSGGRYAFADPEEADSPWRVLDNDTGQARSPASLSGGEQFIASLALALGMVEMMARSGGRLESLFLDEGFGSLDRNNLDAAVEALAMVAARGRMVGVISHVRAVAEQFESVLAVTREESGSRAVWLSNQQRQNMATDALSGLLD